MMYPINDVVVIKRDKTDETPGGIQLLDSHKDPAGTDTGTVLSINNCYKNEHGVWFDTTEVKVGDRVLFMRKHGITVKGSKTDVVVRYPNLLAVLEH